MVRCLSSYAPGPGEIVAADKNLADLLMLYFGLYGFLSAGAKYAPGPGDVLRTVCVSI